MKNRNSRQGADSLPAITAGLRNSIAIAFPMYVSVLFTRGIPEVASMFLKKQRGTALGLQPWAPPTLLPTIMNRR
jgi:hypothetical protein